MTTVFTKIKHLSKQLVNSHQYIFLTILALFFSIMRINYSVHEDMGVYISDFAFIAKGHDLYTEIYENKDPLFMLTGGLFFYFFGILGPYLLDTLLIITASIITFKISLKLNLNYFFSLLSSFIFLSIITGSYYQGTLRSTLFAIVILLLLIYFTIQKNVFLSGLAFPIISSLKMPFLVIAMAVIPSISVILFKSFRNKSYSILIEFLSGVILSAFLISLCIYIWSDLNAYFNVILDNFNYRSNFSKIIGRQEGILGHIKVFGYGNFILSVCFLIYFAIKFKKNINLNGDFLIFLLLPFFSLLLITIFLFWPHHLHFMVFYGWPLSLLFLINFQSICIDRNFFKTPHIFQIEALIFLIITVMVLKLSGILIPLKPVQDFSKTINPKWTTPVEKIVLDELYETYKLEKKFARIGPNDDLALGAFIDKDWRLVCNRYAQYGNENKTQFDSLLSCINNESNYLILSNMFFNLTRYEGDFEYFRNKVLSDTITNYVCFDVHKTVKSKVCIKK